ncbi:MAG: RNA 2',3'-cyclic phosphodiesterase [Anaerolineae bacterium]
MSDGIRIFVAISITDEVREVLEDIQIDLGDMLPENAITWTRPKSMHLTLAFLGDGNQPEQVAAVCDLLDKVTADIKSFPLRLGAIGCFPRRRNPKVIHTGLQGGVKQLHTLKERLDSSLEIIDYKPEARKYTPHLTLGRVRKPDQVEKAQLPFGSHTPPADWRVTAVHLYHSFRTKKRGPQYKIIHSAQLSAK